MRESIKEIGQKFKPPYFLIAEQIASDIEDSVYSPGDRLPASKELSKLHKVHKCTVKKAFELLRKQKILKTVKGIGMVVAEQPKPQTIILCVLPQNYHRINSFLDGARETCLKNKAKIELVTYTSQAEQHEIIMSLANSNYAGAILYHKFSDESEMEISRLKNDLEFPIALTGRPDQRDTGLWQIERNEFHAGYIGTVHLLENRFARIAIVLSKYSYDVAFLNGYLQAIHEFKAPYKDDYTEYVENEGAPGDATRKLLSMEKRPPKAIIYAHPEDAAIGLEIMKFRDIVPGKDIGIVCFGDFAGSENYEPSLTIVRHNVHETGRKAAKLIFTYLSMSYGRTSFQFEKVNPELYEGDSSLKNGKKPISLSEIQRQKRGLIRSQQSRIDRYWRDVYHPGWWKTEPLGWEREELYYKYLYNDW